MVPAMIDTKLMTRETYTLYGIEGDFGNKDGKLTFTEKVCAMYVLLPPTYVVRKARGKCEIRDDKNKKKRENFHRVPSPIMWVPSLIF